jgi:hypothetical protein
MWSVVIGKRTLVDTTAAYPVTLCCDVWFPSASWCGGEMTLVPSCRVISVILELFVFCGLWHVLYYMSYFHDFSHGLAELSTICNFYDVCNFVTKFAGLQFS